MNLLGILRIRKAIHFHMEGAEQLRVLVLPRCDDLPADHHPRKKYKKLIKYLLLPEIV